MTSTMCEQIDKEGQSYPDSLNLLGLSGSLRSASFSTAVLEAIRHEFNGDIALKIKTLEDIPLYNGDLDSDPALPAMAQLRNEVLQSDGLIISTPEYNHGLPGMLKNALDWASRPAFASCFVAKPVLIITCAPGDTGGVRAQYQLRETLISMQAHIVPGRELVLSNVDSRVSEGRFIDHATLRVVKRGVAALTEEIAFHRLRASR